MFEWTRRRLLTAWSGAVAALAGCLDGAAGSGDPHPTAGSPTPVPDGGYVAISLSDWEAITDHLQRFGSRGEVAVEDDRVVVSIGSSTVTVTRDGHVETGMPLHGFRKDDVDTLRFDHDAGHLQIHGEDGLVYEFRRP